MNRRTLEGVVDRVVVGSLGAALILGHPPTPPPEGDPQQKVKLSEEKKIHQSRGIFVCSEPRVAS